MNNNYNRQTNRKSGVRSHSSKKEIIEEKIQTVSG